MTKKYKNRYRIQSLRLQNWDYAWNGAYFVTICSKGKQHYFGEIIDGEMHMSNMGVLADVFWHEIKNHTQNVELGEFIVMPNHIHGILLLHGNQCNDKPYRQERFQNQGKNTVSAIIGSYKSAITKHANRLNIPFNWQSRFYDHIIRDENKLITISEYISNNPMNCEMDKYYNV